MSRPAAPRNNHRATEVGTRLPSPRVWSSSHSRSASSRSWRLRAWHDLTALPASSIRGRPKIAADDLVPLVAVLLRARADGHQGAHCGHSQAMVEVVALHAQADRAHETVVRAAADAAGPGPQRVEVGPEVVEPVALGRPAQQRAERGRPLRSVEPLQGGAELPSTGDPRGRVGRRPPQAARRVPGDLAGLGPLSRPAGSPGLPGGRCLRWHGRRHLGQGPIGTPLVEALRQPGGPLAVHQRVVELRHDDEPPGDTVDRHPLEGRRTPGRTVEWQLEAAPLLRPVEHGTEGAVTGRGQHDRLVGRLEAGDVLPPVRRGAEAVADQPLAHRRQEPRHHLVEVIGRVRVLVRLLVDRHGQRCDVRAGGRADHDEVLIGLVEPAGRRHPSIVRPLLGSCPSAHRGRPPRPTWRGCP